MMVRELIRIVKGELLCGTNVLFNDIITDTRKDCLDNLFIALKGKSDDGNLYIKQAISKGCKVIMTEDDKVYDVAVVRVKNCYESLFLLGDFYRTKYDIPLIGITGSVGKTMTKDLIGNILSKKYCVLKSAGNYNNHIGVPKTLFKLHDKHQLIVCEMGMNHFHEIARLSKVCRPWVGVITNIGTAHIGNLGSKKNILQAKMEITSGLSNGPLVVNGDDNLLKRVDYFNLIKCGVKRGNDFKAFNIVSDIYRTTFDVLINGKRVSFVFNMGGEYLLMDVLLAIQVGLLFNVAIEDIKNSVANFKVALRRMAVVSLSNHNVLIDDCYNASYEAIMGGLSLVKKSSLSKVIILGNILELGKYSERIHKKIVKNFKKTPNSLLLLVGNNFKNIQNKNVKRFENNQQLILYLKKLDFSKTLFYIKGSRAMHLEEIVTFIKQKV
ncbi:MAG: UDP-N-acetylmuramoyl-tripeptide--D-alanyl-D-alanine ligase [Bacilli bacterium]